MKTIGTDLGIEAKGRIGVVNELQSLGSFIGLAKAKGQTTARQLSFETEEDGWRRPTDTNRNRMAPHIRQHRPSSQGASSSERGQETQNSEQGD